MKKLLFYVDYLNYEKCQQLYVPTIESVDSNNNNNNIVTMLLRYRVGPDAP